MSLNTTLDNLQNMVKGIEVLMKDLLLTHSSLYFWNTSNEPIAVISVGGDYAFGDLDEEGKQIQSRLLDEYRRFHSILACLLRQQPKDAKRTLESTDRQILSIIEQHFTWYKDAQEVYTNAQHIMDEQFSLLRRLYDYSEGEPTFVPDTNALLYNHILENWRFVDTTRFTVVLTPSVLLELDELKINHRNEEIRKKADALIRQIKEYRGRGKLTEGVPLVKGISNIISIAIEPKMSEVLPWFDPDNRDDRILASFIELMRMRPHSPVVLVSRDINMQNKAEFAHLPFIEPPEP